MLRAWKVGAAVLAAAPCVLLSPALGGGDRAPAPATAPAAARVEAGPPLKPAVVKSLQEALKDEQDPTIRLYTAQALIRVAPDDEAAAGALVKALTEGERTADAYHIIEKEIAPAPPALVRALLPVLKDPKDINRQRAAVLLAKVDPKAMP